MLGLIIDALVLVILLKRFMRRTSVSEQHPLWRLLRRWVPLH